MAAVDRRVEGQRRLRGGARARLPQGGRQALALALPNGLGPGRLAQLARGQGHGAAQQVGLGQGAQRKAHAVGAGAAAKRGAQVGPGLAQLVLVQRRLAALRGHALAGHQRGGAGQAGLGRRVAPAAGVEIELHVQHRNGRALDQPDLGAAGLRPVLNGNRRPRRCRAKNDSSARQERASSYCFDSFHDPDPNPRMAGYAPLNAVPAPRPGAALRRRHAAAAAAWPR